MLSFTQVRLFTTKGENIILHNENRAGSCWGTEGAATSAHWAPCNPSPAAGPAGQGCPWIWHCWCHISNPVPSFGPLTTGLVLEKMLSPKALSSTRTGCPGQSRLESPALEGFWRPVAVPPGDRGWWGRGSPGGMVELNDLKGLLPPKHFCDSKWHFLTSVYIHSYKNVLIHTLSGKIMIFSSIVCVTTATSSEC